MCLEQEKNNSNKLLAPKVTRIEMLNMLYVHLDYMNTVKSALCQHNLSEICNYFWLHFIWRCPCYSVIIQLSTE